ncbi:MAG: CoA protein activase [Firmicutes bacterium]|nr:CoA protein activase [Bacillota bacterium]
MRVTFPHLGTAWVGVKHLLQEVGFDVIVPPPITRATLELGAKHSPEFICLPFKVMIGNYLQAIEAGAEAIFMLGGIGPCRLGYYAEVQREILGDLGLPTRMIVLERDNFVREVSQALKANGRAIRWHTLLPLIGFSLAKVTYLDSLEAILLRERYREKVPGYCSNLYAQAVKAVDRATTWSELRRVRKDFRLQLEQGLLPRPASPPLRIGVVGEIYMLIESSVNFRIGERLGELGASVTRNLYSSNWVREHLLPDWRAWREMRRIARRCQPYLPQRVGGHGFETIGYAIDYAQQGYDGIVQILPLTCMPEIIAESILPTISRDYGIPVLTVTLDEHAGEAGLVTRLEAFVDMLQERRRSRLGSDLIACSAGN